MMYDFWDMEYTGKVIRTFLRLLALLEPNELKNNDNGEKEVECNKSCIASLFINTLYRE